MPEPRLHFGVHLCETRLKLCQLFVDFLDAMIDLFTVALSGKIEMPLELSEFTLPCAKFFFHLCLFLNSVDKS